MYKYGVSAALWALTALNVLLQDLRFYHVQFFLNLIYEYKT